MYEVENESARGVTLRFVRAFVHNHRGSFYRRIRADMRQIRRASRQNTRATLHKTSVCLLGVRRGDRGGRG